MATDIQHENLDGIFRLWLNWVMVAGAISLLVILSLWGGAGAQAGGGPLWL